MWGVGARLDRHEREQRDDLKHLAKGIRQLDKKLDAHSHEARTSIEERHEQNQSAIAALRDDLVETKNKVRNIIWIATVAMTVLGVVFKDFIAPLLERILGVKL